MIQSNLTWEMIETVEKDFLGRKEFKFVVIHLSNGCRYFFAAPAIIGHKEIRHKELVKRFCEQNSFTTLHPADDNSITKAKNTEDIILRVEGGGTIVIRPKEYSLSEQNASADYGRPRCVDVAEALQQLADESSKVWSIEILEVR